MFGVCWSVISVMKDINHTNHTSTGLATQSGNTLTEIAVHEGKLDVIKYLVNEQGVNVNGEF